MTINLDDLEAIARDATPGPWIADPPSAWDTDEKSLRLGNDV